MWDTGLAHTALASKDSGTGQIHGLAERVVGIGPVLEQITYGRTY